MRGKEKCKALKEIRRQIAEENDIPYVVSQCTHQGDCRGTCPRCEAELRYLERELAIRQGLGKAVAVVGISTSVCAGLTACRPVDMARETLDWEETAGATSLWEDWEELVPLEESGQEEIEGQTVGQLPEKTQEPETSGETESPERAEGTPGTGEPKETGQVEETEEPEEIKELEMGEIQLPEETAWPELEGDISISEEQQWGMEEEIFLPEEAKP